MDIKGLWLPQFIWNDNQSIWPQNMCHTAWNCTTQTQGSCYVLITQNTAKPTRFIKHDHSVKSLSTLQVFDELGYLAIPPCLWGSQEVCHQSEEQIQRKPAPESAISRQLFRVTMSLVRRVWCHQCSFLSTQTSPQSKGWPGPQSKNHRFHVNHPYNHSS